MAVSFASKLIPSLFGSGRTVSGPFAHHSALPAHDAELVEVDFTAQTNGQDENDTFELMPGETGFRERVLNTIRNGAPEKALILVQRALDRAAPEERNDVLSIAEAAQEAMIRKGYMDIAQELAATLNDEARVVMKPAALTLDAA